MRVEAICLQHFVHDRYRIVIGQAMQPWPEELLAKELERAGLVMIKTASNSLPQEAADAGKAQAAGQAILSSALLAAQVSQQAMTSSKSSAGKKKIRRTDTR